MTEGGVWNCFYTPETNNERGVDEMAKPIEPTPILTGLDAESFRKSIDEFRPDSSRDAFLRECVDLARRLRF